MFELLYSCQFLYLLNKAPSLNGIVCYSTVLCTVPKELLIGVPNFLNVGSTTKLKPPPFSAWNFTNSTLYRSYLTSTHPFQVNVLIKRCMKLTHSTTDTSHQFTNTHPTEFPKLHLHSDKFPGQLPSKNCLNFPTSASKSLTSLAYASS